VSIRLWDGPHVIERVADRQGDAESGPHRSCHPDKEARVLPVSDPMWPLICGPMTGISRSVESSTCLWRDHCGRRSQESTQSQQQGEHREEALIRHLDREARRVIVDELLDDRDRDGDRGVARLSARA